VPAGEGGIVHAREVVDPGVDRAVDLLDQAGDRLDALPALAGRGVGRLRRLQVAGPDRVGEHRRGGDGVVHLPGDVAAVVVQRAEHERVVGL
jgi:hypothetical protein